MRASFLNKLSLGGVWPVLVAGFMFFSCKEDEKPTVTQAKVNVTGIELISGIIPNAMVNASVSWQHLFPTDLQITFKSGQNGKSYDLKINPNDFSKSYSLDLPSGTYTYQGSTSSANPISPELPITVTGDVQVGTSALDLKLKGYSTYGLLTFSKRNIPY